MTRVIERLQDEGLRFMVLHHAEADTSIGEAIALGIAPDEVAKTLVVKTGGRFTPVVIPATRRLDMGRLRAAMHDQHARLATEAELRERFPDFELGAFPPLPELFGSPAYVDPEVLEHTTVVFATGDRSESLRMRTADLFPERETIVAPITHLLEL